MKKNNSVRFLVEGALIAALYAVLTYVASMLNLAYGPFQFRFSEALTILPVFTPAAIPGLAVGCFIGNLGSPLGPVDWIFGTSATLIAALISRSLRNVTVKGLPLISFLAPVIINAVVIGLEIACLGTSGQFDISLISFSAFAGGAFSVGVGQLAMCVGLGVPLFYAIKKSKVEKLMIA